MANTSSRFTRSQFRVFLKIEIVCILALCITAVVASALVYVQMTIVVEKDLFSPIQTAQIFIMAIPYYGIVPTALLGAPIYAFLKAYGQDSWANVQFTGLAPGFVLLFINSRLGIYTILCGGIIATIVHLYFRNVKMNT
jgi:hypothetical protein